MAYRNDPSIEPNIKALIVQLTKFKEGTDIFNHIHGYFVNTLRRMDFPFSTTKHEIDKKIDGLAEKFTFHGYAPESKALKNVYSNFIGSNVDGKEMKNKVAVMQFLFAMSRCPTGYLASLPEGLHYIKEPEEEDIDWGAYLMEGIEVWKPNFDDSDDDGSDFEETSMVSAHDAFDLSISKTLLNESTVVEGPNIRDQQISEAAAECKKILSETCQSYWFNSIGVRDLPDSEDPEARVALNWEEYLAVESHGLLGGPTNIILSEYKVLREILWQLVAPHESVVFAWSGNELVINDNVTIPSLRPFAFKSLVSAFLPHIRMLHDLSAFHRRVMSDQRAPHTYRGYAEAAMSVVRPANARIAALEAEIMSQETTVTLISFGTQLANILQEVKFLHRVHCSAILDYDKEPQHACCIHLLSTLYSQFHVVAEKQHMDVLLALYMEAAYKYVRIIEEWFRTDRLVDTQKEFPLAFFATRLTDDGDDYSVLEPDGCTIPFGGKKEAFEHFKCVHRSMDMPNTEDPLVTLIKKEVMPIGRQLRLFSLLGKLHLLHETNFSIYDEWRQAIFHSLREYSTICAPPAPLVSDDTDIDEGVVVNEERKECIIALDGKYSTEFDFLEYSADTADSLLMAAYQDVFYPKRDKVEVKTTYQELQEIGTRSLPVIAHVIADTLSEILSRKYSNSGRILKEVFIRDHHLGEHITILAKVFLFAGDVIFPFYRRVFEKIEANASWGNDIWLTYDLQDVLVDAHPRLHECVRVGVRPGWETMLADPLRTCTLIDVQYQIEWPIDIIVMQSALKMYRELFYFILKIKWALHTLNHLGYSRAQKKRRHTAPRAVRVLLQRLEVLRFGYINIFAAIQHYILGYVYCVCRGRYEREFEAATDLEALIISHEEFIDGFHRLATRVRDYQAKAYGFDRALYSVRQLRKMWLNPGDVLDKMLQKTEDSLRECHRNIFDVISVQVYD